MKLKNKTVIGIIAIVIGILICFLFTPLYNQSLEAKTNVVRVVKDIEKGQLIKADMIQEVEVGSYNLSDGIVKKKEEIIGKYANTEMFQNEYIITEKLSDTPIAQDEYLQDLDGKKGAISITVQTFAAGLSGKLFANDIVSIIVTDEKETMVPPELKYVQLLACTTNKGKDVDENTKSEADDEEDKLATTVTLLVNDEQAKTLANLEATSKIHIELVYRGSREERSKYLEQQEFILEEMKVEKSKDEETNTEVNEIKEETKKSVKQKEVESNE